MKSSTVPSIGSWFLNLRNSVVKYYEGIHQDGLLNSRFSNITSIFTIKPFESSINMVSKAANNIVTTIGDTISTPAKWLKGTHNGLLTYMIIVAIILLSILILYCVIRYHLGTRKVHIEWLSTDITSLSSTINNKDALSKCQLPSITRDLRSVVLN